MSSLFVFAQESHACNITPTSMASTWDNRDPYGTKGSDLWDKGILFMGQRDPYLWDKGILFMEQRDPIYGTKGILSMEQSDPIYTTKASYS